MWKPAITTAKSADISDVDLIQFAKLISHKKFDKTKAFSGAYVAKCQWIGKTINLSNSINKNDHIYFVTSV